MPQEVLTFLAEIGLRDPVELFESTMPMCSNGNCGAGCVTDPKDKK